jgi:hypothetical protein
VQYHVKRAVIDALPETRKARELQSALRGIQIWLAYYVQLKTGSKNVESEAWDIDKSVVNLDRTRTMDQMYARFFDGKNTLPGFARDVQNYYDQMKAPVRVLEDNNGEKIARYIETGADHFAHAENYCAVASKSPPIKFAGVWGR